MNLLMQFIKLKTVIKAIYKAKQFHKHSCVGLGTKFGQTARCINQTGDKCAISIGCNCDIDATISAHQNSRITIGDCTTIRYNSVVGAVDKIQIGSHVIISNNVHIYDNNNHPTDPKTRWEMCETGFYSEKWNWKYSEHRPIKIEDNVWIGERCTILKGVVIGEGSIIGCDSVVTHNIPPYTIAAGNPAKVVKKLND